MSFITLFQLNSLIQNTLEQHLEPNYWVVAEIGEMRVTQKGHCYIELVEKEGQHLTAKIRANIWAYDYRNLSGLFQSVTGKRLQPGMKILVKATVQFHEVFGLSLQIRDLDPNFTLGERARQRQKVIDRLSQQGVLDRNKEHPLPPVPQRVAVISAETAAGYGDFIDQLVNNPQNFHFEIRLYKTIMQGVEAVPSICASLDKVYGDYHKFDVLVVIRGGGSQVDLDCFDDYEVAYKLSASPLPVITGIGHERDETVVDLIAHTRMKTPTAVAEFLLSGMQAFEQQLNALGQRLRLSVVHQIQRNEARLIRLGGRLDHNLKSLLQNLRHRHNLLAQRLKLGTGNRLIQSRERLRKCQDFLVSTPFKILAQEQKVLSSLEDKIALADPERILERGFSITYKNGTVLKSGEKVKVGDTIVTQTKAQRIDSTVSQVENERKEDKI